MTSPSEFESVPTSSGRGTSPFSTFSVAALDLLPVGVCVIDDQFRIWAWNQRLQEWTGIAPQVAIGAMPRTAFPR